MKCWAYGPAGHRCDQDTGEHNVDEVGPIHSFTITWNDDECIDPSATVATRLVGQTNTERPVPIFEMLLPDDDQFNTGICFTCGCDEIQHGPEGCGEHGCSTFVP